MANVYVFMNITNVYNLNLTKTLINNPQSSPFWVVLLFFECAIVQKMIELTYYYLSIFYKLNFTR